MSTIIFDDSGMSIGYIYAIKAGGTVKIGWAGDPERRLNDLSLASPLPLRLLGFVEGTKATEKILHRRFKEHHLRGEWFSIKGQVVDFIESLPPLGPKTEHSDKTKIKIVKHRIAPTSSPVAARPKPEATLVIKFNYAKFLREKWGDPDRMVAFLRNYGHPVPRPTVNQWFRRGSVPAEHFAVLIALVEIDTGTPFSAVEYII